MIPGPLGIVFIGLSSETQTRSKVLPFFAPHITNFNDLVWSILQRGSEIVLRKSITFCYFEPWEKRAYIQRIGQNSIEF